MCEQSKRAREQSLAAIEEKQRVACPQCDLRVRHYDSSWQLRQNYRFTAYCPKCSGQFEYTQEAVYTLAGEDAFYFTKKTESCDPARKVDYFLHGRACGCRFCADCTEHLGIKLRESVREVVKRWRKPMMWTLQLNPDWSASPREALEHCRDKRVVSRLVRELRNLGCLNSKHYFCVIEWQKNGFPHWHLLVDANFVKFETVVEIWNRFAPKGYKPKHADKCMCEACSDGAFDGPVILRPRMGGVRFSAPKFSTPWHAANYATKYLVKVPESGYPDWILDARGIKIARYSTSRGFFGTSEPASKKPDAEHPNEFPHYGEAIPGQHGGDCFCDSCRTGAPESYDEPVKGVRPIRERVAACRSTAVLLKRVQARGKQDTWHWLSNCKLPFLEAKNALGLEARTRSAPVSIQWVLYLSGELERPPVPSNSLESCDVNKTQLKLFEFSESDNDPSTIYTGES